MNIQDIDTKDMEIDDINVQIDDGEKLEGGMGLKRSKDENLTDENKALQNNKKQKIEELSVAQDKTIKKEEDQVEENNKIKVQLDLGLIILFFFDMIHDFCETPVLMSTKKNAKENLTYEIELIIKMFNATFSGYDFFDDQPPNIISDLLTKVTEIINKNVVRYSRDYHGTGGDYTFESYTYQGIYDDLEKSEIKNKLIYDFILNCYNYNPEKSNQVSAHSFLERGHKLCYFIASVINDRYFFKKHRGIIDLEDPKIIIENIEEKKYDVVSKLTVELELQQCNDYNTIGDDALLLTNETDYHILQLPNISSNEKYFDLMGRQLNEDGIIKKSGSLDIIRPVYLIEDALKSTSKVSFLQSSVSSSAEGNNLSTYKEMYVLYTTSGFYDEAANKLACYEPLAIPDDNYISHDQYGEIQSNMQIIFENARGDENALLKCNFQALNEEQLIKKNEDYKQELFKYFKDYYTSLKKNDKNEFINKLNNDLKNIVTTENWLQGDHLSFIFSSLLKSDDNNQGNYYGQIPNAISSALKSEYNTKNQLLKNTTDEISELKNKKEQLKNETQKEKEIKMLEKENKKMIALKEKLEKGLKKLEKDIDIALVNDKAHYEMSKTADNIAPKMVDALKTYISDDNQDIGFSVPSKITIFKRIRDLSESLGLGITGYEEEVEVEGDDVDFDEGATLIAKDINQNLDNFKWNPKQENLDLVSNPIMNFDRHYINILTFSKNGTIIVDYDNDIGDDKSNDIITKIQQITIPEMVKKLSINNEDIENFVRILLNFYIFDSETMEENNYISKSPVLELLKLYSTPTDEDYFEDFMKKELTENERINFITKAKTKKVNLQIEKGINKTDNIPDASVTDISQLFREKLFLNLNKIKKDEIKFKQENIGTRTDGISENTSKTLVDLYNKQNKTLTDEQLNELFMILFRKTMGDFSQIATVKHLSEKHNTKPIWFISFDIMAGIIALYHGTNTISVRLSDGKLNEGYVLYGSTMLKKSNINEIETENLRKQAENVLQDNLFSFGKNEDINIRGGNDDKSVFSSSVSSSSGTPFSQISVHGTRPIKIIDLSNTEIMYNFENGEANPYIESGPDKEINIIHFTMVQNLIYKNNFITEILTDNINENDNSTEFDDESTRVGGSKTLKNRHHIQRNQKTFKNYSGINKKSQTRKQKNIRKIKHKFTRRENKK